MLIATAQHLYALGQRDAIANVFTLIRADGLEAGLKKVAEGYLQSDPDNPHVKHFLAELAKNSSLS